MQEEDHARANRGTGRGGPEGGDLGELVRQTVEDAPDGQLEEQADDPVGAERHERTAGRKACRAGRYDRRLATTPGEAALRTPKPRGIRPAAAIVERHRSPKPQTRRCQTQMGGRAAARLAAALGTAWAPPVECGAPSAREAWAET